VGLKSSNRSSVDTAKIIQAALLRGLGRKIKVESQNGGEKKVREEHRQCLTSIAIKESWGVGGKSANGRLDGSILGEKWPRERLEGKRQVGQRWVQAREYSPAGTELGEMSIPLLEPCGKNMRK